MKIIQIIIIATILQGCSVISEHSALLDAGISLYKEFKPICSKKAFEKYPKKIVLQDVQKSRTKQVKDGMVCDNIQTQTRCKYTYRNVKEYFYVKEHVDINKKSRNRNFMACLKRKCNDLKTTNPTLWYQQKDTYSQNTKMQFCSGRGATYLYKKYGAL